MEKVTKEQRAEAYRQANATNALEGLHMTPEGLALQQKVIDGEWTHEELRAYRLKRTQARNAEKRTRRP
ncbi:MAG TPA: antitoxin VbhA family protein [Candidatus Baltobacteraceae bacterium]|jgi:hypothetical protein|nr:antitoxin VbhA family protein [Candidatus Baltobacteraceae bacterium]